MTPFFLHRAPVFHLETGRQIYILNAYLRRDPEKGLWCEDSTDYRGEQEGIELAVHLQHAGPVNRDDFPLPVDNGGGAPYLRWHPESTLRQLAREGGFDQVEDLPLLRRNLRNAFPEDSSSSRADRPQRMLRECSLAGCPSSARASGRRPLSGENGGAGALELYEKRQFSGPGPTL